MQELVAINIVIGDRTYRIKITPKDEEAVRKVVKVINEKLIDFKTQFGGKDMQDYIAMVLVWFSTRQVSQSVPGESDDVQSQLVNIESALDKALGL